MYFSKRFKLGLILSCFTLSAFCVSYFSRKPVVLESEDNQISSNFFTSDQIITITGKKLDSKQCKKLFKIDFIKKNIQPISISVENNTDSHLKFCPSDIALKTIPFEIVLKKAEHNTFLRTLIWKVTGFVCPLLFIPGTIHTVLEHKANDKIFKRVVTWSANDQLIKPETILESIIFVEPKEYQSEFELYITNKTNNNNIKCRINIASEQSALYYL